MGTKTSNDESENAGTWDRKCRNMGQKVLERRFGDQGRSRERFNQPRNTRKLTKETMYDNENIKLHQLNFIITQFRESQEPCDLIRNSIELNLKVLERRFGDQGRGRERFNQPRNTRKLTKETLYDNESIKLHYTQFNSARDYKTPSIKLHYNSIP
jgi:hypothetical protein